MADRHILYKLQPGIEGEFIADAADVETNNGDVQSSLDQIQRDVAASGRAINIFNDTFAVDAANYNTYVGKNNIYGAARDKNVFPTLPSEAVVTAAGGSYPVELEFQHLGGTARDPDGNTNNNLINIQTQNSEELREGSSTGTLRSAVILRRGDIAVFTKSAAGQPWIVTRTVQDPRSTFLPDGVFTLNTRTVSLGSSAPYGIFGLTGYTAQQGDAFEVRGGTIPAGQDFPEIDVGDVLVAKVNNPSLSLDASNDDWLVIRDARNQPLTGQEIRFLSQVSEVDGRGDIQLAEDATNDALIWLSPAVLATAPFLTPSGDSDNPRTPEVIAYIGGREDRNSDNEFEFNQDRANSYMYVGITPAYVTSTGRDNIDIVVKNGDDTEAARYNLADDFVAIDDATFTNPTVNHYFYSTDGTTEATIDYTANQTIEIWETQRQRHYRLDTTNFDATPNVDDLEESQLSHELQVKLNRTASSQESVDEERLSAVESKVQALFPLTPDVTDLNDWATLYNSQTTAQTVNITDGYSLIADYRGASTRYESAGVTYSDAGTNVVTYTGLGDNLYRTFGFKVASAADQILMWIVDGAERIPFIDMTVGGNFRINNYTPAYTASQSVSDELHFLTRTSGVEEVTTTDGSLSTFTITDFPASATNTSRSMQFNIEVLVSGTDTQAGDLVSIDLPATDVAQAKQTVSKDIFLGPLHGNRTVRVVIGYELRVSGSDLLIDFTLETADSDVTVRFDNVATLLTYTAPATVSRVDDWQIFQDQSGNYTFTGENELLVTFQSHESLNFLNAVGAAIGATGSATLFNDIQTPIPANDFESVEIPDQTALASFEFRTFSPAHFLRHNDLGNLLNRRATQWAYGLAELRAITEHAVTQAIDFPQGLILTSPNSTRYTLTVADDGSLKTEVVT